MENTIKTLLMSVLFAELARGYRSCLHFYDEEIELSLVGLAWTWQVPMLWLEEMFKEGECNELVCGEIVFCRDPSSTTIWVQLSAEAETGMVNLCHSEEPTCPNPPKSSQSPSRAA